ncbi:MAG: radical SAM protein [Endomicrobium sp.]|jgi:radical SAM protein with 4Fe4S-binding SPASM domain|uniref:SPASM domain-containing protein n=1 Tax=Candidatus Endomicrobiellum cubanum TaxID=3242325 RepID=UPI00282D83D1|nr:radical SAM protein [Endomicrobium sp.]
MIEETSIDYFKGYPLKVKNQMSVEESERYKYAVNKGLPLRVSICTTTMCNLRCKMCKYHGQAKIDAETLDYKHFVKIADELFPYAKELHIGIKGEAFLTPYLNKIPDILKKFGTQLNVTTNGMLLSQEVSHLILPVLRDVKISFDGATKQTFEKLRPGANFDQIIKNIKEFVKARDEYMSKQKEGTYRPTLTLQSVLMKDNINELPDIIELAHDIGADRVKGFNLIVLKPEFLEQSLLFYQDLANKNLKAAKEIAEKYKLKTKYQDEFDTSINIFTEKGFIPNDCNFLWRQINIEANGDVIPCCHFYSPAVGNIFKSSVQEIWNNSLYQKMRKSFSFGNHEYHCLTCPMASKKVVNAKSFILTTNTN